MTDKISARIVYGDLVYEVSGSAEEVIKSVLKWMSTVIPSFDLFRSLSVDIDYVRLSESLSKYVMISGEGDIIFKEEPPKKLSLGNRVLIALGVAKLSNVAGRRDAPSLTLRELTVILGKPSKTISSRLSELHYDGYVRRIKMGGTVHYEITVKGLLKLMNI